MKKQLKQRDYFIPECLRGFYAAIIIEPSEHYKEQTYCANFIDNARVLDREGLANWLHGRGLDFIGLFIADAAPVVVRRTTIKCAKMRLLLAPSKFQLTIQSDFLKRAG